MAKLDGLEMVLDFLKGLQPKIAAQIAKKVLSLNFPPRKTTKALSKGSCSDFCTTHYWVQSL